MASQQEWQDELAASIRRMQEALVRSQAAHGRLAQEMAAAIGAHALERVSAKLERKRERWRRREERRRSKRARRKQASRPVGLVMAGAAAVMLVFAFAQPHLWWLVFVALGLGIGSASNLASAHERGRGLPGGEGAAAEAEPSAVSPGERASEQAAAEPRVLAQSPALALVAQRVARVDAICEKLATSLAGAPAAVRELVRKPEETVKALRAACHELARRERELRAAITEDDDERLRRERAGLEGRVAAERDEIVRSRLGAALKSLDGQLAQRAELSTAALRFEAEGTRILYSLENLHTQVLRARSADAASADVAGAGLRRSLEQISQEVDAVAEALEVVHRGSDLSPVQEIRSDPVSGARPVRDRA